MADRRRRHVKPEIAIYPDSDKIGTRPGVKENSLNFRCETAVDYWEGESDTSS